MKRVFSPSVYLRNVSNLWQPFPILSYRMLAFLAEPLATARVPRWVNDSREQDTGTCDMALGCAFSQQRLALKIFIVLGRI